LANGLQAALDSSILHTFMAAQADIEFLLNHTSHPPANATRAVPCLMLSKACAMALPPELHAAETTVAAPLMPKWMEACAAIALFMILGT